MQPPFWLARKSARSIVEIIMLFPCKMYFNVPFTWFTSTTDNYLFRSRNLVVWSDQYLSLKWILDCNYNSFFREKIRSSIMFLLNINAEKVFTFFFMGENKSEIFPYHDQIPQIHWFYDRCVKRTMQELNFFHDSMLDFYLTVWGLCRDIGHNY